MKCCVPQCRYGYSNKTLFKFPKGRKAKQEWLNQIPGNIELSKTSLVCINHFAAKFIDSSDGIKLKLTNGAVPTRFPTINSERNSSLNLMDEPKADKPTTCRLCLVITNQTDSLDIFSLKTETENIAGIISSHFWFMPNEMDQFSKNICTSCWTTTKTFHDFYQKIRVAQDVLMLTTDTAAIAKVEDESMPQLNNCSPTAEDIDHKMTVFNEHSAKIDDKPNLSASPGAIQPKTKKPTTNKKLSSSFRDDEKLLQYFDMRCDKCVDARGETLQFASTDANRTHFKTVHKLMYRCNGVCRRCNVQKTSASKMREHIRWHDKPDEFQCKICLKFASNQYNLRQHELYHLEDEPNRRFECDLCSKRVATKAAIYGHMQQKHSKRLKGGERITASCDKCGKEFYSKSTLKTHIRQVHEKIFTIMCDICGKGLYNSASLKMHKLIKHTVGNPLKVQCKLCGSWHTNKMNLQSHVRLVHLEGMYPCPHCGKEIKSKTNLRYHIKLKHENNKRFKCAECGEAYQKNYQLLEHVSAKHTGEKPFHCEYCAESFSRSWKRNDHIRKVHAVEYQRKKDLQAEERRIVSDGNSGCSTNGPNRELQESGG